jgi:hypothetical protein
MLLDHPILSSPDHKPARTLSQLVPCVYIALRCQHCGELRQALASAPLSENVDCPICSASCIFLLLGRGITSSPLPFHELYPRELTRWINHDPVGTEAEAPAAPESQEAEAAEAHAPETLDGS